MQEETCVRCLARIINAYKKVNERFSFENKTPTKRKADKRLSDKNKHILEEFENIRLDFGDKVYYECMEAIARMKI